MNSVLQCSRQLGEAQGLQGGLPAFGVYGAEGWVSLGSVCSQALPVLNCCDLETHPTVSACVTPCYIKIGSACLPKAVTAGQGLAPGMKV